MGTSARIAEPSAKRRVEPERLAEEQAALRRVATLVAGGAPSSEVFEAVATEVAQVLRLRNAAVCRYDDDGAAMTVMAAFRERGSQFHPGSRWPLDGPSLSREVFRTGRPVRIEDYTDLPGTVAAEARRRGYRRVAGAPIIVDGRVWGIISTTSPDAALPDDLEDRLGEFTELVATAIANSQAHDELTRLANGQAALRRVATLVAAAAPPAEVFEAVSAEVAALIPADGSALTRYESDGSFTALSGWTAAGGYSYVGRRYELEGTVSGLIFETGRPGRIENYAEAPGEARHAAREMGWRSSVGAPISVEGRLWGALAVVSKTEEPLPPETEQRLAEFTELVATAIANSEAHQELARLADEQEALRRVATLAAEGAPPDEVFRAVSAEVTELVDADGAGVTRYEADGTFSVLGGWTRIGSYPFTGRRFPLEGSVSGLVRETRRPCRIENFEGRAGEAAAAMREAGWRSAIGVPISVEGHLWGVLLAYSKSAEPLPPDTERHLDEFTQIVAAAIANTESREEIKRLADEQAALRRVATLVAEGGAPDEVFEAISREVGGLVPADVAYLSRFAADGTLTALGSWARSSNQAVNDVVGETFPLEPGTAAARVFATRRAARADTYEGVTGKLGEWAGRFGWRSGVGVPLLVEGALWGLVLVGSTTDTPLPPDTEARLAEFTELLATAIANAEGRAEVTQLAEEQATLRRVATLVARGAAPKAVFAAVRDEVARLLGFPRTVLLRYDGDGMMTLLATDGDGFGPAGSRWAIESPSVPSTVLETGRAARMDARSHGPFAERSRRAGVRSAVGVPVVVDGSLWGLMATGSAEGPLPRDTEERLAKFTELLATAIANAEGRAELDASRARIVATADATRRRLERDLHDGAQQQLVSLALEVRAAQASSPEELSKHRQDLSHIAEGLTAVLDGLREIALGIHPAILAEGGLGPAVKTLAHRSPIPVELDVRGDRRLAESVEVAAYYVVSEALTNAAKHSGASKVEVGVEVLERTLCVTVRDDGVGGADPARGSGLLGLKDRAEAIGGSLSLESRGTVGTTLVAELPLDRSIT